MADMSLKSKEEEDVVVVVGTHQQQQQHQRKKEKENENWSLNLIRKNDEAIAIKKKELEDAYKAAGLSYNPVMDAIRANPAALAIYTQRKLQHLTLNPPHDQINRPRRHLNFINDIFHEGVNRKKKIRKMEMEMKMNNPQTGTETE